MLRKVHDREGAIARSSRRPLPRALRGRISMSSFIADRYADLRYGAGFKPPGFEGLNGKLVEHCAAGALEHPCVSDCSGRGINRHHANAASGEVAAFRFVRVLRQRRADCHGLRHRKRHRDGRRDARHLWLHKRSRPLFQWRFLFHRHDYRRRFFRRRRLFGYRRHFLTLWRRGSAWAGLGLFLFGYYLCWQLFRWRGLLRRGCSVLLRRRFNSLRARFSFFLFRLLGLNHLAGLKLVRKTRRSSLLSSTQVCPGERNASAHNDENSSARTHRRNLPPCRGKVKLTARFVSASRGTRKTPLG